MLLHNKLNVRVPTAQPLLNAALPRISAPVAHAHSSRVPAVQSVPQQQQRSAKRNVRVLAQAPTTESKPQQTEGKPGFDINERVEFLKEDLKHLFDDKGIDPRAYDDVVEFRDPITQYNSLSGYLFNIQMLKRVFDPVIELHDIRAIGPYAVLSRWTMSMDFTPARVLPIPWQPRLMFSGTSTYCFNPSNGRINKHIDTWDSIQNQEFFSIEAFADVLRQMADTSTVPEGLEQPQYRVIRRTADYQIRTYDSFVVAQTFMDGMSGSGSTVNPAAGGSGAFNTLARYLFGGNERSEKMEMTTPVFSDTKGNMQFVMEPSKHQDVTTLPSPSSGAPVALRKESVGTVAVRSFNGLAFQGEVEEEANALFAALKRDGVPFDQSSGWRLARYNDPGTLPPFRRNEVMVKLADSFDPVWTPGELESFSKAYGK